MHRTTETALSSSKMQKWGRRKKVIKYASIFKWVSNNSGVGA
jgi:hypothetical protein